MIVPATTSLPQQSTAVPGVSFEFFPPSTPELEQNLWSALEQLAPLGPRFVSVTYGAGGSTRERTHELVAKIRRETDLEPAAHLTCVGASASEVDAVAQKYWQAGVRHIVAIRGDPPQGVGRFQSFPGGYANSAELVRGLKRLHPFEISVGCYPEGHPDSTSRQDEIDHLKRKIDAGATRAITQYFFEADRYFRFVDFARAANISVPIVPGILPVFNFKQAQRFSAACGASIPKWLGILYEGLDDDPEARKRVAVSVAAENCRRLRAGGVEDFHFYTLNRADLTQAICRVMGIGASAHLALTEGIR